MLQLLKLQTSWMSHIKNRHMWQQDKDHCWNQQILTQYTHKYFCPSPKNGHNNKKKKRGETFTDTDHSFNVLLGSSKHSLWRMHVKKPRCKKHTFNKQTNLRSLVIGEPAHNVLSAHSGPRKILIHLLSWGAFFLRKYALLLQKHKGRVEAPCRGIKMLSFCVS